MVGHFVYRIAMRYVLEPTKGLEPLTCCLRNGRKGFRKVPLSIIHLTAIAFFIRRVPPLLYISEHLAAIWLQTHYSHSTSPESWNFFMPAAS